MGVSSSVRYFHAKVAGLGGRMGWAKYFEDIQKLRDDAQHRSAAEINRRNLKRSDNSEKIDLIKTREYFEVWSQNLISGLDEILEQATDPEINRQIKIEELESEIQHLNLQKMLLDKELHYLNKSKLEFENRVSSISEKLNIISKENQILHAENENRQIEVNLLKEKIMVIEKRESENNVFHKLMAQESIRKID
jgi:hypothetical protein